jgi:hypothetical protein
MLLADIVIQLASDIYLGISRVSHGAGVAACQWKTWRRPPGFYIVVQALQAARSYNNQYSRCPMVLSYPKNELAKMVFFV